MYEEPILFSHCSYGRARVLSLNYANNNNTWISVCRFLYTEFNSNIVRIEFCHTQIQAHIHTQVYGHADIQAVEYYAWNYEQILHAKEKQTTSIFIMMFANDSFICFCEYVAWVTSEYVWVRVCVCAWICNRETNQRPTKREKDAINWLKRLDKPNRLNN